MHTKAAKTHIPKEQSRRIAITFDDGPNEPYTSIILDSLAKSDVRATFFQVGTCIRRHPEITRRAFAEGHIIGNHTSTHTFHRYFSRPLLEQEILDTQQLIHTTIGKTPTLFRAPWFFHIPLLHTLLEQEELTLVKGSLPHTIESLQPPVRSIVGHAASKAQDGAILIFHDGFKNKPGYRGNTAKAIPLVIDYLRDAGYELVTVDEILGIHAYQE